MKKLFVALYLLIPIISFGQMINIPLDAEHWEYDPAQVEFITHRSVQAAKSKDGAYFELRLKDQAFTNGTIEFDVELIGNGFPGISFRMSDDWKNGEIFYIRSFGPASPHQKTNIQYAAIIDGVNMWDMTEEYQTGATIYTEGWNHVKLVINGKQMKVYVNETETPSLIIPELEGGTSSGGISLTGNVIYANFKIDPSATGNLHPEAGFVAQTNDTRYLRNWEVTEPVELPTGTEVVFPVYGLKDSEQQSFVPGESVKWTPIKAEKRGMVNLTRKFGASENGVRRFTWLKTTLTSQTEQERILNLGFSDEVWILINGQLLYEDHNYFGTLAQTEPNGRCTLENAAIKLPLKEGENEILVGVTNFFYGWGIVARMDKMSGITIE